MSTFEQLQIEGLQPSLIVNKLGLSIKTLSLLFSKIRVAENGCWEWMGRRNAGYGQVKIRALYQKAAIGVHRVTYQLVNGPIPGETHIHHKTEYGCMGPACCNPAHMAAVTATEHVYLTPSNITHANSARMTCASGHPYDMVNLYVAPSGVRECRICRAAAARAFRLRQKGGDPTPRRSGPKMKDFCKRGHPLSGDNLTLVHRKNKTDRKCKACHLERQKAYDQRKKGVTIDQKGNV